MPIITHIIPFENKNLKTIKNLIFPPPEVLLWQGIQIRYLWSKALGGTFRGSLWVPTSSVASWTTPWWSGGWLGACPSGGGAAASGWTTSRRDAGGARRYTRRCTSPAGSSPPRGSWRSWRRESVDKRILGVNLVAQVWLKRAIISTGMPLENVPVVTKSLRQGRYQRKINVAYVLVATAVKGEDEKIGKTGLVT